MTDEQKRPPTSEEMIRRARERTASSQSEASASQDGPLLESAPESPGLTTPRTGESDPHQDRDLSASTSSAPKYHTSSDSGTRQPPPLATPPYIPSKPSQPPRLSWFRRIPVGWLIAGVIFAGGSIYQSITSASRDESGVVVGAGDVASDALQIGDCLLFPQEADPTGAFEFDHLTAVPCSEPHDMEVFAQVSALPGPYPGTTALSDLGDEKCAAPFETYVGHPVEHEARLTYSVTYPNQESWTGGDRSLDCLLETWDGTQMTGSQKGQGLLSFGGLVVDSCYDYTETETFVYFTEITCEQPHLLQLYEASQLPHEDSTAYPGDSAIEAAADDLCVDPFFALIPGGSAPEVDFFWVTPDADSWQFGDRLLQCFLFNPGGNPLVGNYTAEG